MLSDRPPSLQTFALYGSRFGGIVACFRVAVPHFKDYKSAAFEVVRSHLRDAAALTGLFLLLDAATLIALVLGMMLVHCGQRSTLDGRSQRGLSFLQLGLRQLQRLCYQGKLLPPLKPFPPQSPPAAVASERKREQLDRRIQFSRITAFSS